MFLRTPARATSITLAIGAAGAIGVTACDDGVAPRLLPVTLTLCDHSHWVAYQNDGGAWVHLGPGTPGSTYTFRVTPRLAIARARFQESPPASDVTIDWLAADQLVPKMGCTQGQGSPGGFIGGSVAGLTDFRWATVYYNGIGAFVPTGTSSWSMEAQPVPAMLFAGRYDSATSSVSADRVIIRRNQSYLPGTQAGLLDFESAEAFAPSPHTVSATAPRGWVNVWFMNGGREHALSSHDLGPATDGVMLRTAPFATVPAAELQPDDLHLMSVAVVGSSYRTTQLWFREGSDRAVTLPPELAVPTFTDVVTAPASSHRRVRAELPSQAEFGGSASVTIAQFTATRSTRVTLNATREYFGALPNAWSFEMPDLGAVAGFQLAGALGDGEFSWFANVASRRFGQDARSAQAGDVWFFASRSGTSP